MKHAVLIITGLSAVLGAEATQYYLAPSNQNEMNRQIQIRSNRSNYENTAPVNYDNSDQRSQRAYSVQGPRGSAYFYQDQGMSDNDQQLTDKIRNKLKKGWFSDGYEQVNVFARNGIVTIQGTVDTWDDKRKIMKEIWALEEVRDVNPQLNVREPMNASMDNMQRNRNERNMRASFYKEDEDSNANQDNKEISKAETQFPQDEYGSPQDRMINAEIRKKTSEGWLWDSNKSVKVSTMNGMVTLTGNVKSQKDMEKLITKIKKIDGVRAVRNELRVTQ